MPKSVAPRRQRVFLVLLTCLGLAVAGLVASPAHAANPAPVLIRIDGVSSATTAPAGSNAPYALIKAGDDFHVNVSFWDADNQPASFNSDTALSITSSVGALSTVVVPKGNETFALTTHIDVPANQVSVTVSVQTKRHQTSDVAGDTTDPNQLFDVVSDLRFEDTSPGSNFSAGIGGDTNCAAADRQHPVCGIVLLPNGAKGTSSNVLLSLGKCDATYTKCDTRGAVVQALADLGTPGQLDGLYSTTSPATVVIKCDKVLCPGGKISDYHLQVSLNGNDALQQAAACPAKGTMADVNHPCVDYVQSTRDGAGDTLLYLLFAKDVRISVG
jgi:hypothetical protein